MNKTVIAIASAASLSLLAGPLAVADTSDDKHMEKSGSGASTSMDTAQVPDPDYAPDFNELDQNQDGQIDEDELNMYGSTAAGQSGQTGSQDYSEDMMKRYDQDGDGSISEQEMQQGHKSGHGNQGSGMGTETQ
jgi:hypothetical protein